MWYLCIRDSIALRRLFRLSKVTQGFGFELFVIRRYWGLPMRLFQNHLFLSHLSTAIDPNALFQLNSWRYWSSIYSSRGFLHAEIHFVQNVCAVCCVNLTIDKKRKRNYWWNTPLKKCVIVWCCWLVDSIWSNYVFLNLLSILRFSSGALIFSLFIILPPLDYCN